MVADMTLRDQLRLFADHGVMVTPTGAGLANVMLLPQSSSVVEVFPALTDSNLGRILAVTSGVGHYPVHTYNATYLYDKTSVWKKFCVLPSTFESSYRV